MAAKCLEVESPALRNTVLCIHYRSHRESNRARFLSPMKAVSQKGYEKTSGLLLADTGIPLECALHICLKCQTSMTTL